MYPLYTFGYTGRLPHHLRALAEHLDAIVVDIRFSPRSRIPDWTAGRLQQLLGERYLHLPAFGNRNYRSGPLEFVDLEAGVSRVGDILAEQSVILLCACADLRRCHRRVAAEAIASRYGVTVQHC